MQRQLVRPWMLALTLCAVVACDDGGADASAGDGALADATTSDAGGADASGPDAGPTWLEATWPQDTAAALPERLSALGIYADPAARTPSAAMFAYAPRHPLWSNGADKQRLLYLPPGERVVDWVFPVGTLLVKTFAFEGAAVETRLLLRRAERWDYAVYVWDGDDATWQGANWQEQPVEGRAHTVPGRLDCRTCHESAASPVLGIQPWQLDLAYDWAPRLEGEPLPVEGRTPEETAVLRYFVGNCIACHNGGDGPNSAVSFHPDVAVQNLVNQEAQAEGGAVGVRVVPGDPEASVLFTSVVLARQPAYRGDFKPMPPLGIQVVDPDVEALLRDWIESL
ncbi:MAG: hypothetical protein H6704_28300 [Myxococcales bacterium]|nr:hypothetical protein [Myxococcales bacterium]